MSSFRCPLAEDRLNAPYNSCIMNVLAGVVRPADLDIDRKLVLTI